MRSRLLAPLAAVWMTGGTYRRMQETVMRALQIERLAAAVNVH